MLDPSLQRLILDGQVSSIRELEHYVYYNRSRDKYVDIRTKRLFGRFIPLPPCVKDTFNGAYRSRLSHKYEPVLLHRLSDKAAEGVMACFNQRFSQATLDEHSPHKEGVREILNGLHSLCCGWDPRMQENILAEVGDQISSFLKEIVKGQQAGFRQRRACEWGVQLHHVYMVFRTEVLFHMERVQRLHRGEADRVMRILQIDRMIRVTREVMRELPAARIYRCRLHDRVSQVQTCTSFLVKKYMGAVSSQDKASLQEVFCGVEELIHLLLEEALYILDRRRLQINMARRFLSCAYFVESTVFGQAPERTPYRRRREFRSIGSTFGPENLNYSKLLHAISCVSARAKIQQEWQIEVTPPTTSVSL